jgi:pimeloyl-ACP methyl ester carboxylesterase
LLLVSTALILLFLPLRPVLAQITSGDILFIDDFSSGSLGSWIIETGNWHIQDGQLVGSGYGRALGGRTGTGNTEWDNYIYELDVLNRNGIDEGLGFRRSPDGGTNSYEVIVRHGTGDYNTPEIILAKVQEGQLHILHDTHDIPLVNNQKYHFKFSVEGEHLQGWVNDSLIYDLYDSGTLVKKGPISLSYNSGDYGIAEVFFDNIKVTSLNPSTSPTPSISPTPSPIGKTPLIFIPGIAGSELKINEDVPWVADDGHGGVYTHTYNKDEVLWLNGSEAAKPGNDDYFDALRMLPDGKSSQAHVTPTGKLLSIYDPMIKYLTDQGYVIGQDLYIFGYDWRKDLSDTSLSLKSFIDDVKQQTNISKVNILTHSMGGLIAKKYIDTPENANLINKLVAVAPPYLGSPKSLLSLLYGNCLTTDKLESLSYCFGIPSSETKDIVQNLISIHTLKPTRKYYQFYNNTANNPYPIRDESDADSNLITGNLNYDQTKQFLTNLGLNTSLYNPSENFHLLDETLQNTNGVDMTIIVGSGKPTLGQIIEKNKYDFFGRKIPTQDEIIVNGDATVPLFSASLNDPSRNLSLFNPQKVFYANDTHGGIISNPTTLDFALNTFNNTSATSNQLSDTPTPLSGSLFSVHSPVLIDAYDTLGNHTGPTSDGNYETNIPNSTYKTIDDAKFIFLPNGKYQFKFKATDQGSFDFKIREFSENKNISSQIYKDITLTQNTTGYIVVDQINHQNSPLNIDLNDDNLEDKQYYPAEFQGDSIDALAPKTTVILEGQKGDNNWYKSDIKVTLSANDESNGSGISKTEYSLDGGITVLQYDRPFTISQEGISKLRIKSTDNAGNEEQLQTIEVKIDKTAPEARIIFNLITQDFDFIGRDTLSKTTTGDSGQIVTLTDEAGNSTKLTLTSKDRPRRENVSLKSIQYNSQKTIKLDSNLIGIFYTLDKKNQINFMLQRTVIRGEERLYTFYNPLNNTSEIIIKKPKTKLTSENVKGKILLFIQTDKGDLKTFY